MSNPTYKGKNPKHLVDDTKAIVNRSLTPELTSATTFGNQMLCIAYYFLSKEVRETGTNSGKFIDEWNRAYANNDADFLKQAAWCTIFMWKIAEDASKLLKCANPFPNYNQKFYNTETRRNEMVWGNARKTVDYLAEKGINFSKSTPTVGCMMFRNSKSASSSGHWGIVTDVTKDTFRTIEGNVALSDGTEGVGYWEYPISEIFDERNGILFAQVQLACQSNEPLKPYNGWSCQKEKTVVTGKPKEQKPEIKHPPCVRIDPNGNGTTGDYLDNTGKVISKAVYSAGIWFFYDKNVPKWTAIRNCDEKLTPLGADGNTYVPVPKDYEPAKDTQNDPEAKEKICRNIIVTVPQKSQLQHYSVLRDKKVIADITGANFDGISSSERNGSALWYNNRKDLDPKHHTGFGMFKDKVGNLIYFLDLNQPQSKAILENGFLGYNVSVDGQNTQFPDRANTLGIYLSGGLYNGGGWLERFVQDILNNNYAFDTLDNILLHDSKQFAFMPKNSHLNHVVDWTKLPDKRIFGYLEEIENNHTKLEDPIIIFITERTTPPSLTEILNTALSIATTMTMLVGIPIPPAILNTTKSLVAFSSTGGVNFNTIMDFVTNAASLAEFYAPETVKSVKGTFDNLVRDAKSYIKVAEKGLSSFINEKWDSQSLPMLKDVQKTLGIDWQEIQNLFSKYQNNSGQAISLSVDLTKLTGELGLTEVNKTVENLQNMLMLDQMRRGLKAGTITQNLMSTANAMTIPIVQDLFASSGANSVMATFPKFQQFTGSLLNNNVIADLLKKDGGDELRAGLIGQAFGLLPIDKGIFKPLQLEALISRANVYRASNTPLVLPESLEPEYKDCFQFVIEKQTEAKVINCPDGWEWDRQLKKCVNPNAHSGWTSQSDTKIDTTVITNSGNGSTNFKKKKEDGNTEKGSGFDFGRDTGWGTTPIDLNFDLLKKTGNPNVEVGKVLPIDYLPPCLVREGNRYYYYPYGKPKAKKEDVVTLRPSEKKIFINPIKENGNGTPTLGTVKKVDLNFQPPTDLKYVGNLPFSTVSSSKVSPLTLVTTIPKQEQFSPFLPTLNDLPEKVQVVKSGNKWVALINGMVYDFDPINCKIIGYKEPYKEEEDKDKIVTKKDLENEIAKREKERQEAEKKARDEATKRAKESQDKQQEAERQKQLDELRERNRLLIEQNKKLQTETVDVAKNNSQSEEYKQLVNLVNLERERTNEAIRQLNAEKTTSSDDVVFKNQLTEMQKNIENEKARNKALQQEIALIKNKPTVTKAVTAPDNSDCDDCDKLGMPKRVETHTTTIYGYPESECNTCPRCGGCEDECECY